MGSHVSKPENKFFSPEEILHFQALLNTIAGSGDSFCTAQNFKVNQKYCDHYLDEGLANKLSGSDKCFLFHLHPKMLVYPSTGFNNNFQYLNIQQQTMPNGLGLGGKLDYFGLWIDADFGNGKCAESCTTFESPQLSENETFSIQAIEVWGVGPPPATEDGLRDPEGAKSIIDQDPLARAVLELINKPAVSDGYWISEYEDGL